MALPARISWPANVALGARLDFLIWRRSDLILAEMSH